MPPLPSYGYGRERPGPRYGSLIHGQNLKDVVITGNLVILKWFRIMEIRFLFKLLADLIFMSL